MGNEKFDKQDSLQLINSMINTARGNLKKGAGKYFILWGYIVFLATLVHFFVIQRDFKEGVGMSSYIWLTALCIGVVITFIFGVRERKNTLVRTYTDNVVSSVWMGFGCSAVLISFLLSGKLGAFIYPSILFVYTFALFISARAYKFKWMYISVTICLLCIISYKFIDFVYFSLPMAVAMLCGNIVPGHMLNRIADKQNV